MPEKSEVTFLLFLFGLALCDSLLLGTVNAQVFFMSEAKASQERCEAIQSEDGSSFDWSYVEHDSYFEVCLKQLAETLETPEKMARWLRSEGFIDVSPHARGEDVYLNAQWREKDICRRVPLIDNMSFLNRWFTNGSAYRVQVYYEDEEVRWTSAHYAVL